ncbi:MULTISPECIES: plasmid stabilization protein [Mesorhizobium]|uniref:Plasmid stabilization protein n=1 Tax=Mesorhizobium shonense TaxID=1209948 RepID=A0ABV2I3X7_9HYPH|nr:MULTISPECIES: plasmid stabilization protein [unclassified Mesorhizobium]AZO26666.1 plasmid stabilization protein [Mesorhizobium sp. M1B.F.Ca.ET.045.04.1.1]RWA67097.1 MAG: plasmid stabilization protein [Mesorhizobium sp.]RWA79011.1 MAG: plasmid stabilization protein [Mesorhizobium sp.]RWB20488.1 MAG: plasmid stabilization protein [Mesorhizobium sp.]RWD96723.1 MAG: plasmid stabilization protein [Mesorhizobium sp.]
MAEPKLSVRSAKSMEPSSSTRRENRSIADVIERALESYEIQEARREPASSFYARLVANSGADIDLEKIIREGREL